MIWTPSWSSAKSTDPLIPSPGHCLLYPCPSDLAPLEQRSTEVLSGPTSCRQNRSASSDELFGSMLTIVWYHRLINDEVWGFEEKLEESLIQHGHDRQTLSILPAGSRYLLSHVKVAHHFFQAVPGHQSSNGINEKRAEKQRGRNYWWW